MLMLQNIKKWAHSDRMALVDDTSSMTYAELEARSEAAAVWLSRTFPGVSPVGLCGDKEHDMMVLIVAAIKTGRPYVVMPGYYPATRLAQIAENAKPCAVICAGETVPDVKGVNAITHDELCAAIDAHMGQAFDSLRNEEPDDIITIIYTSGSTGTPKGVPILRRSLDALADAVSTLVNEYLPDDGTVKRMVNILNYAFSASLRTVFYAMGVRGMTMYAIPRSLLTDTPALVRRIIEVDPHYMGGTSSFIDMCMKHSDFHGGKLPSLRFMSVGGDNIIAAIGLEFMRRFPDAALVNGYGSTELCSAPLYCRLYPEYFEKYGLTPVGIPMAGAAVHIWDENDCEVPDGVTGELVVDGVFVTNGYYHDEERSAGAFTRLEDGTMRFRTRDVVCRRDGLILYVGRADNQVQIGGNRVEPEEIEFNMRGLAEVRDCAVVPMERGGRAVMLCAYVVPRDPDMPKLKAITSIKRGIKQLLPASMVPHKIVMIDALPKNTNGKLDRSYLKNISRLEEQENER